MEGPVANDYCRWLLNLSIAGVHFTALLIIKVVDSFHMFSETGTAWGWSALLTWRWSGDTRCTCLSVWENLVWLCTVCCCWRWRRNSEPAESARMSPLVWKTVGTGPSSGIQRWICRAPSAAAKPWHKSIHCQGAYILIDGFVISGRFHSSDL